MELEEPVLLKENERFPFKIVRRKNNVPNGFIRVSVNLVWHLEICSLERERCDKALKR